MKLSEIFLALEAGKTIYRETAGTKRLTKLISCIDEPVFYSWWPNGGKDKQFDTSFVVNLDCEYGIVEDK